ncbi:hypothetical protein [uncultured Winogradskyella sp.]|uniref:hypothetical protein n=1 Tax=uncultured Winogradskyella sp. TaxID=395353 RepID=UPI0026041267|nr:hypothetical protein [uncultured Winogradskyella sp.]
MNIKQQKERKLGILRGLMICEILLLKNSPPKTPKEAFNKAKDIVFILKAHYKLSRQPLPNYPKGGLSMVGNTDKREVILKND